jgi:hypothetical protein
MAHAGYRQTSADDQLPAPVRAQLLDAILGAHDAALDVLRARAFSTDEARALAEQPDPTAEPRRRTAQ